MEGLNFCGVAAAFCHYVKRVRTTVVNRACPFTIRVRYRERDAGLVAYVEYQIEPAELPG